MKENKKYNIYNLGEGINFYFESGIITGRDSYSASAEMLPKERIFKVLRREDNKILDSVNIRTKILDPFYLTEEQEKLMDEFCERETKNKYSRERRVMKGETPNNHQRHHIWDERRVPRSSIRTISKVYEDIRNNSKKTLVKIFNSMGKKR
jgi:hypothetical protein